MLLHLHLVRLRWVMKGSGRICSGIGTRAFIGGGLIECKTIKRWIVFVTICEIDA